MGQEVTTDASIALYFDQPMDHDSVANALQVTPAVEGDFEWPDDATVIFRPTTLTAATRYRVALVGEIRSASGLSSSPELAFAFSTLTPLAVTRLEPAHGAVDVRIDAPVLLAFNRAMVPPACVGKAATLKGECWSLPLTFTPTVMGTGVWLDTSLYRFDPFRGWAAGKVYSVVLAAGVRSVENVALSAPVAWTFTTALPIIREVSPADGQTRVPRETAIRVIFNTPMDRDITASAFRVTDAQGENVPGMMTWEDNGARLVFTPALPLNLEAQYFVQIGARARAATSAPLENPLAWSFTTVPYPAWATSIPENGAANVDVAEPVRLIFAGALNGATLVRNVIVTPTAESLYTDFDAESGTYYLSWDKEPRTRYCVGFAPGIADVYGNVFTATAELCFTTGDLPPFIGPATTSDAVTLDAAEPAMLSFLVRNLDSTSFTLSELDEVNFVRGRDVAGTSIRDWEEEFAVSRNVATLVPLNLRRLGNALPTGYYQLVWDDPLGGTQSIRIGVVDRHVTLKLAAAEALVWITDLYSGEPISRTAVRLVDHEGLLIAAGTTDSDGLAAIPISPRLDLWENVAAIVGNPGAAGFGVAVTHGMADAAPETFAIALDGGAVSRFTLEWYTDRPLYRPGQALRFRGALRENDGRYLLPSLALSVEVTLRGPGGQAIYSTTVALSDMGTFAGAWVLPENSAAGDYALEAALPGVPDSRSWRLAFRVASPRRAEFEVVVTPEDTDRLNGAPLRARVAATYDTGDPVRQTPATWNVRANNGLCQAALTDLTPGEGSRVAEGQAVTDAEGRFLIEIPAHLAPLGDSASITSQCWTIEATLSETNGFPVSGYGQVTVHPSRFYVQANPRQWVVRAGTRAEIDILTLDWEQLPVADQAISVAVTRRAWQRNPAADGVAASRWIYTDTQVSSVSVTTDVAGKAVAAVNLPHSGNYIVSVDTQDADGQPVHTEVMLWVSGNEVASWPTEAGRVTPVADLPGYRVGETAKILVPVALTGPYQMLMTVEREGILRVERRVFDTPNPVVEIPILDTYVPNVYVSFIIMQSVSTTVSVPDVWAGYVKLTVEPTEQTLTVEVLPDKAVYEPGDEVTLIVRATDSAARPVAAELGVALVDKAMLALRKTSAASTSATFYGERPLRVMSGDGLLVLFNRVGQTQSALAQDTARLSAEFTVGGRWPGGGAINVAFPSFAESVAFLDPALWETHVRTNGMGEARLTFRLPDAPATWVAEVRAITADTKVGVGRVELPTVMPLLVRPAAPRFLVVGDQAQVAAVICNNTSADITVTARLTVEETTLLTPQRLTIPAGGRARVDWAVPVAPTGAEVFPLDFSVEGGGYRDVARLTLPLYRYVTPDVVGTAGVLAEGGTRLEAVMIPQEAGEASALTVRVEPTLLSAVVDSLTYLEQAPYASTDVLIARFLSNGLIYSALQDGEVADEALLAQLQASAGAALERLYARQNPDGGWGWGEADESTLQLTAYAVLGMTRARQAGFSVREMVFAPALAYVSDKLALDLQSETRSTDDALALYVLSEANAPWPVGAGTTLYAARETLGKIGCAYLTLALGTTDPSDSRIPGLLEGMRREAQITATSVHWESVNNLYWDTDAVLTALIVDVLARFAPEDPLLTPAVRWLMLARCGDHWQTTYETAWAISGLTAAWRVSDGGNSAYDWRVALNGVSLAEGAARAGVLESPGRLRAGLVGSDGVQPLLVRDRPNVLEVFRTAGAGQLYYSARLEAALLPVASIAAASRGFTLRREYCAVAAGLDDRFTLCQPVTALRSGEVIEVRLTLIVPQTHSYVLLEDPYPAGLESVDGETFEWTVAQAGGEGGNPFGYGERRAEQAVFIAQEIAAGTYRVTYRLRAVTPGTYQVLPATVTEIYFPVVWGRTAGQTLTVLPPMPR